MEEENRRTAGASPPGETTGPAAGPEIAVVRRSGQGWRVGDEELTELTSAMVLADLLAAEQPAAALPAPPSAEPTEAERLRVTVAQLESALVRRVKVEQAIGIVCERRHMPPVKAFELIRSVARANGTRVAELAARIVDSAANPLLTLPEELARPLRQPRVRGKSPRHVRVAE
ncbi:MAG TPA: ANTAR domain-containing protein [Streptosporangiaceae bacterium]|jgi:hypothetical protein